MSDVRSGPAWAEYYRTGYDVNVGEEDPDQYGAGNYFDIAPTPTPDPRRNDRQQTPPPTIDRYRPDPDDEPKFGLPEAAEEDEEDKPAPSTTPKDDVSKVAAELRKQFGNRPTYSEDEIMTMAGEVTAVLEAETPGAVSEMSTSQLAQIVDFTTDAMTYASGGRGNRDTRQQAKAVDIIRAYGGIKGVLAKDSEFNPDVAIGKVVRNAVSERGYFYEVLTEEWSEDMEELGIEYTAELQDSLVDFVLDVYKDEPTMALDPRTIAAATAYGFDKILGGNGSAELTPEERKFFEDLETDTTLGKMDSWNPYWNQDKVDREYREDPNTQLPIGVDPFIRSPYASFSHPQATGLDLINANALAHDPVTTVEAAGPTLRLFDDVIAGLNLSPAERESLLAWGLTGTETEQALGIQPLSRVVQEGQIGGEQWDYEEREWASTIDDIYMNRRAGELPDWLWTQDTSMGGLQGIGMGPTNYQVNEYEVYSDILQMDEQRLSRLQLELEEMGFYPTGVIPNWGYMDDDTKEAARKFIKHLEENPNRSWKSIVKSRKEKTYAMREEEVRDQMAQDGSGGYDVDFGDEFIESNTLAPDQARFLVERMSAELLGFRAPEFLTNDLAAGYIADERFNVMNSMDYQLWERAKAEAEGEQAGGAGTADIDVFMRALSGQESSGDPTLVNPESGAYGEFQIMPDNWGPWARAAGLDPNDRSQGNQNAVARHRLLYYYNVYGNWADVASAWYAGGGLDQLTFDLNAPQGRNGDYPSVNQYVGEVMNRFRSGREGVQAGGVDDPEFELFETQYRDPNLGVQQGLRDSPANRAATGRNVVGGMMAAASPMTSGRNF